MKSIKIALLSLAIVGFTSAVMNSPAHTQEENEYVGEKGCAMCHKEQADAYKGNAHAALPNSCEECHGPGHKHAAAGPKNLREWAKDKKSLLVEVPKTLESCGECHKRNSDLSIAMASEFVLKSNQEYPEMLQNKHADFKMNCTFCHDPHAPVDSEKGIKRDCLACHTGRYEMEVSIAAMADLSCEDCHMPMAVASGKTETVGEYQKGNIKSHLFAISVDPDYSIGDGSGAAVAEADGKVRMTVEMTCYACHKSGEASEMTHAELLEKAAEIHAD